MVNSFTLNKKIIKIFFNIVYSLRFYGNVGHPIAHREKMEILYLWKKPIYELSICGVKYKIETMALH